MNNNLDSLKVQTFISIVQTDVICYTLKHPEGALGNVRFFMAEAWRTSKHIPADMSARDAADDFCIHLLRQEGKGDLPPWMGAELDR